VKWIAKAGCYCRKSSENMHKWTKKIVLVGLGEKFEVWNEDAFTAKENDFFNGEGSDEGLAELGDLSF